MLLGYNTNGFAHHRLDDACAILSDIGYKSIAITLEREHLDPPDAGGAAQAARVIAALLKKHGLRAIIETGARFILDPRRKHQPTLISAQEADRRRRIEFINGAIEVASRVGADGVSLWSGTPENGADDDADGAEHFRRLTESLAEILDVADRRGVRVCFEPEPGMLIDTMASFERLHDCLNHPRFGLTLDAGHVHCLADGDVAEHIRRWRKCLWNVHIEDMRAGVHDHLMFGDGDMDFDRVFAALQSIDYAGPVHVELSRHSHNAVEIARRAFSFLEPYFARP